MNCIIIEDELLASKNLSVILSEIGHVQILTQLESITETVEWLENNPQPDIIFMDIHLADGSAFEIFDRVEISCPVIFTTAYDEYALQAFKVNSIDYLLKPIEIEAVKKALLKYDKLSASNLNTTIDIQKLIQSIKEPKNYKSNILLHTKGDKLIPLSVPQIAYIYIESGIVRAITFDKQTFVLEDTLDTIYTELNPIDFYRANRQFIIARKAIKDLDLWFNSRLVINLIVPVPEKIYISKARNTEFKNWFTS